MRLFLLLYVPRSGSTLFASLVAKQFSQVLVIPELRLPKLLLLHHVPADRDYKSALLDLVRRDHQFAALELSSAEVEQCIDRMEAYTAEGFLLQIAEAVARKSGLKPEVVLYKCGSAGLHWSELRQRMPATGLIHIYRDARAAVNSAMHTERPYHPGQRMGRGDPWFQARTWNRFVSRMDRFRIAGEPIHEIKYEDLCESPDRLLRAFASEVGISGSDHEGRGLSVSPSEVKIHRNVGKAAMPERSEAWQHELPAWQGMVVEHLTLEQLTRRNYPVFYHAHSTAMARVGSLAYGYVYHLVATFFFHARRILIRLSQGRNS